MFLSRPITVENVCGRTSGNWELFEVNTSYPSTLIYYQHDTKGLKIFYDGDKNAVVINCMSKSDTPY